MHSTTFTVLRKEWTLKGRDESDNLIDFLNIFYFVYSVLNWNDYYSTDQLSCSIIFSAALRIHGTHIHTKTAYQDTARLVCVSEWYKMNFGWNTWKCETPDCSTMLTDQFQRCSYKRKFCDECRREKYLDARRKRLEQIRVQRYESDIMLPRKSVRHAKASDGYEPFQM